MLVVIDTNILVNALKAQSINSNHIEPLPSTQKSVPMKDEDDRVFFDVAKCVNARLITRNYKDYPVHELVTLIDELYKS